MRNNPERRRKVLFFVMTLKQLTKTWLIWDYNVPKIKDSLRACPNKIDKIYKFTGIFNYPLK